MGYPIGGLLVEAIDPGTYLIKIAAPGCDGYNKKAPEGALVYPLLWRVLQLPHTFDGKVGAFLPDFCLPIYGLTAIRAGQTPGIRN